MTAYEMRISDWSSDVCSSDLVIGKVPNLHDCSAISLVILPSGSFFILDTYVTPDPTAEEVAEMTLLAAQHVRRFGLTPKVALLSYSSFGSSNSPSAQKRRTALALRHRASPRLAVASEIHAQARPQQPG